ncbi:MAG: methyltransferase domain-containing protein [Propionibacteriaceae bacterium]|nr:methyltransferase domain-containing protein [Propionibacteriaceae bacterium]
MPSQRPALPQSAFDWLIGDRPEPGLAVGAASLTPARHLVRSGSLTLVDRGPRRLAAAAHRHPGLTTVAGAPDALPFASCSFGQVVVAELLHTLPPRLSLAEFARVLRVGGTLAVLQTVRDDSVPWVRRLAAILRQLDPTAMTSDESATGAALAESRYFPTVQQRRFRLWVPATKPELLAMVERLPAISSAEPTDRLDVLSAVGALYDGSARAPEPLLLPYSVVCWRAVVDHTQLTAPIELPQDGLRISI